MEARLGEPLSEDLGEPRPGDVREEADLLRPDPATVLSLRELLGRRAPVDIKGETPREVALLVHALRGASLRDPDAGAGARARNGQGPSGRFPTVSKPISSLLDELEQQDPAVLKGFSRADARELVRSVFRQMRETLTTVDEGLVRYEGLGRFRVTKVESGTRGKRDAETRIGFRPAGREGPAT
jgi:hypothetical protein